MVEVEMHGFLKFPRRRRPFYRVDRSLAVEPMRFDGIQPRTPTRKKEQQQAGSSRGRRPTIVGRRPAFEAFVP